MAGNTGSNLHRYRKVIQVLLKYGFEDIVAHPPFNRLIPPSDKLVPFRKGKSVFQYSRFERFRLVCEELGTTFIKIAQVASNRPDIFPEELITELVKLQDSVPAVGKEEIRELLKSELGAYPEDLFVSFDYQAVASASIAQVHRAILHGGQEVVFKVLRPGTVEIVEADMSILKSIAGIIEQYFPKLAHFKAIEYVNVFEKTLKKEMKFKMEASNIKKFAQFFKDDPVVVCPKVFPEFSTNNVLCLEYIKGYKINDLEGIKACGWDRKELAQKGIDLYFEQIFFHGYFHADPHPGNIFVLPEKKICFLDFGMMGTVTDQDKELFTEMILTFSRKDKAGMKKILLQFSSEEDPAKLAGLDYEIADFFNEYSHLSIHEIDMEEAIALVSRMFFDYKIQAPANMMLIGRALAIVEGLGLMLDPDYNIFENIKPFGLKLLKERLSFNNLYSGITGKLLNWSKIVYSLPDDLNEIVQKVKNGKLKVEFEHKGLGSLNQRLESIAQRISYSMIIGSLLVGSSLIINAHIAPYIYGIPVLGFAGLLMAAILGIRMFFLK